MLDSKTLKEFIFIVYRLKKKKKTKEGRNF